MDHTAPRFRRRAAAGLIDLAICLALTIILMVAWMYAYVGSCECPTAAGLERYFTDATIAAEEAPESVFFVPTLLYVLWSWTPLAGGRSVGKRAMGLRTVVADARTHKSPPTEGGLSSVTSE